MSIFGTSFSLGKNKEEEAKIPGHIAALGAGIGRRLEARKQARAAAQQQPKVGGLAQVYKR
jgi:hypothetical protein